MKKLLSVLLALLMTVSVVSVAASAAAPAKGSIVYDELMNDDVYYHVDYVKNNKTSLTQKIDLYTALNLYDNAWENFFTGNVNINYAKAILLAVIEKVDVEYQNESFEKFVKILEGASSVADLINKVNKYTGLLDFAESNEWATSIEVLNNVIRVANYGNAMYEKFIDGYASILSARAASIYYSEFLTRIADNCQDTNVRAAAREILADVEGELEDAVKALVAELAAEAVGDAAEIGVDTAMSLNSVTAVIKKVYKTTGSLANKLFKTEDVYGYMCSLLEVYYIEECMTPWVAYKLKTGASDDLLCEFWLNAQITLRELGENFLSGLALTTDRTLKALVSGYNVDTLKVRSAAAVAKLDAIRQLLDNGVNDVCMFYTVIGNCKVIAKKSGNYAGYLANAESKLTATAAGYVSSVYNEGVDGIVKVFALTPDADNLVEITAYDLDAKAAHVYFQVDTELPGELTLGYATFKPMDGIKITALDVLNGETVLPTLYVEEDGNHYAKVDMADAFSVADFEYDSIYKSKNGDKDAGSALKNFFNKIAEFFKKLFGIFK